MRPTYLDGWYNGFLETRPLALAGIWLLGNAAVPYNCNKTEHLKTTYTTNNNTPKQSQEIAKTSPCFNSSKLVTTLILEGSPSSQLEVEKDRPIDPCNEPSSWMLFYPTFNPMINIQHSTKNNVLYKKRTGHKEAERGKEEESIPNRPKETVKVEATCCRRSLKLTRKGIILYKEKSV